ncbi:MAG: CoA transferase, partial [Anaerolineales bacterium]|nr:CoA transferase [Anaerolineales bacterium]
MSEMPLARFTVLDLTRVRSGPTAVRQLADWGANVIKIERPGGLDGFSHNRLGFDFQNLHRNKRSMTLDLKAPAGRDLFLRLVKQADVVVENYRPDVKERLRIAYDDLRAVNPGIVLASISGFGQTGPYRDLPGFDQVAQGLGGLMSITGLPGQGPVRAGIPVADLSAGLYCAIGILVALLGREATGQGQWVQTSLLQAQVAMLDFQAVRWLMDGVVPPQAGNNHPTSIPTGVFQTTDGHINLAAAGDHMFVRLCEALGADELKKDAHYQDGAGRLEHRDELNDKLQVYFATNSSAHWVELLNKAGVPCGP